MDEEIKAKNVHIVMCMQRYAVAQTLQVKAPTVIDASRRFCCLYFVRLMQKSFQHVTQMFSRCAYSRDIDLPSKVNRNGRLLLSCISESSGPSILWCGLVASSLSITTTPR